MEVLQSLLKFQPWAQVVNMVVEQISARERVVNKPVDSIGGVLSQNYEKGIIVGMKLAVGFPAVKLDVLREEFNMKLTEVRQNVQE